jgi:hypothetical protein
MPSGPSRVLKGQLDIVPPCQYYVKLSHEIVETTSEVLKKDKINVHIFIIVSRLTAHRQANNVFTSAAQARSGNGGPHNTPTQLLHQVEQH